MRQTPDLSEVPIFKHLDEDERAEFEELSEPARFEAPTVVGEMGLLTEPRAAASVEAMTIVEAHGVGRDRLLEMLDADSPAACKLVYEIGRTLAERMAATNETVAEVIFRLENTAGRSDDIDIFRDQLIQDWSF